MWKIISKQKRGKGVKKTLIRNPSPRGNGFSSGEKGKESILRNHPPTPNPPFLPLYENLNGAGMTPVSSERKEKFPFPSLGEGTPLPSKVSPPTEETNPKTAAPREFSPKNLEEEGERGKGRDLAKAAFSEKPSWKKGGNLKKNCLPIKALRREGRASLVCQKGSGRGFQ